MDETAKKLGCTQSYLTYIEQGKTNPSPEFLKKCIKVYEIPETEWLDFYALALSNQKKLLLDWSKISTIPKETLIKLMVVLIFNLKEPQVNTGERDSVYKAIDILTKKKNFTTLLADGTTF